MQAQRVIILAHRCKHQEAGGRHTARSTQLLTAERVVSRSLSEIKQRDQDTNADVG
jgi:hypothetical protein